MCTEQHKLDLLRHEGYEYYVGCPRGWHYKGMWVGATVEEALKHKAKCDILRREAEICPIR